MVISYPLCLCASITFHIIMTTVASLTSLGFYVIENQKLQKKQSSNYLLQILNNLRFYHTGQFDHNIIYSKMEKIITQAYDQKNWKLISQFLLNKQQMIQVQYALGSEDFLTFVSTFQAMSFEKHQGTQLLNNHIYYFISQGFLIKKQQKVRENKLKKIRKSGMKLTDNKLLVNLTRQIPKGTITRIQSMFIGDSKSLGYYYSAEEENLMLRTCQQKIPFKILTKIKQYFNQKLKFINKLDIFSQIPKNFIQENMEKFKFIKISFNEIIYSKQVRQSAIFILMKGQAMIDSGKKSIIVRPPNILGDEKMNQDQQAHCLTEYSILFSIQRKQLEEIFKKLSEVNEKEYKGISRTSKGLLRASFLRNDQMMNSVHDNSDFRSQNPLTLQFNNISHIFGHKNRYRKTEAIDTEKKNRIKQHFSNFLNEKFKDYESKISQNLSEDKQKPILYQIKPLLPTIPNYEQLHIKLKEKRLKKILLQKQKQQKKPNQIHSILMQVQKQEKSENDLNSRIKAKIIRALDMKIAMQMNKRFKHKIRIL